jgi:hypothetical protein
MEEEERERLEREEVERLRREEHERIKKLEDVDHFLGNMNTGAQ